MNRRPLRAPWPTDKGLYVYAPPAQQVPWHSHTHGQDTFYALEGDLRLFLRDPKEEVRRQGIGEYDYVPLTAKG